MTILQMPSALASANDDFDFWQNVEAKRRHTRAAARKATKDHVAVKKSAKVAEKVAKVPQPKAVKNTHAPATAKKAPKARSAPAPLPPLAPMPNADALEPTIGASTEIPPGDLAATPIPVIPPPAPAPAPVLPALHPEVEAIVRPILEHIGAAIRDEVKRALAEVDAARATQRKAQDEESAKAQAIVNERLQWQKRIDTLLTNARTVGMRPRARDRVARH